MIAWLTALAAATAPQAPDVVTLQVPLAERVVRATATPSALTLVTHEAAAGKRWLRSHDRGDAGAVPSQPTRAPYALEPDVVAFALADVDPAPGREVVLFTAERAVAVTTNGDAGPTYVPLFEHRLVWPAAPADDAVALTAAVVDVDGDGRDDFVIPEPDGARCVRQVRDDTGVHWQATEWRLPPRVRAIASAGAANGPARLGPGELSLRLDLGDGDDDERADRGPLLRLQRATPPIGFADLTGDGRADAIAVHNGSLWTWDVAADGAIAGRPGERALPLPEDRLTLFDPAFDVQLADTDGDGRADLLVTTSAQRDDQVEVRIDLRPQQADGGWAATPARLRLQTLAMPPQLVDADGDGRLDLVAVTLRTDLLGSLTGGGAQTVELQVNVFAGKGTRFATPAILQQQLALPTQPGRARRPFVQVVTTAAGAALVSVDGDGLRLQPLTRDGRSLVLGEPTWRLPLGVNARPDRPAAGARELIVRDEHEVLHVRWR